MKNKYFIDDDILIKIVLYSRMSDNEKITAAEAWELFKKWGEKYHLIREIKKFDEQQLNRYNAELREMFKNYNKDDSILLLNVLLKKALPFVDETILSENLKNNNRRELKPLTFTEFLNLKEKKEYYVKDMFAKGTINMIYSPPAQMKTFVSYYLALCLVTGNNFLTQKTKKVNVGYFDWENPISDTQNRIKGMCKGLDIDLKSIDNLFFLPKQNTLLKAEKFNTIVYTDLKEQLFNFIKQNNIKVLLFDTLRRIGNFDENDSTAINTLKSELFDPLINEFNICVVFLHHTSKEGINYRGSVDIEGILDTSFFIKKKVDKQTEQTTVFIKNTKRRNNEIEDLQCLVDIENESFVDEDGDMLEIINKVKFNSIDIKPIEDQEQNYKEIKDMFFTELLPGSQYKNKELVSLLKDNKSIMSPTTQNKIIKWFVNKGLLQTYGSNRNKYYMLNPIYFFNNDDLTKEIEKAVIKKLLEKDLIETAILKNMFDEKYLAIIFHEWNNKGLINTAKKGLVGLTELGKQEFTNTEETYLDYELEDLN